jgi:hypothetical protein
MSDIPPQLLRDAFAVLDRHPTAIANRDPVKSLNEDLVDLLRRVRAALLPLILDGTVPRPDVAEIVQRIDAALPSESSSARSTDARRVCSFEVRDRYLRATSIERLGSTLPHDRNRARNTE